MNIINEIDRYIDNYYANADSLETRDSETEWLHPLNSRPFTSLNRPPHTQNTQLKTNP